MRRHTEQRAEGGGWLAGQHNGIQRAQDFAVARARQAHSTAHGCCSMTSHTLSAIFWGRSIRHGCEGGELMCAWANSSESAIDKPRAPNCGWWLCLLNTGTHARLHTMAGYPPDSPWIWKQRQRNFIAKSVVLVPNYIKCLEMTSTTATKNVYVASAAAELIRIM